MCENFWLSLHAKFPGVRNKTLIYICNTGCDHSKKSAQGKTADGPFEVFDILRCENGGYRRAVQQKCAAYGVPNEGDAVFQVLFVQATPGFQAGDYRVVRHIFHHQTNGVLHHGKNRHSRDGKNSL